MGFALHLLVNLWPLTIDYRIIWWYWNGAITKVPVDGEAICHQRGDLDFQPRYSVIFYRSHTNFCGHADNVFLFLITPPSMYE